MNHIYRNVWNATSSSWVAAPETARAGGAASSTVGTPRTGVPLHLQLRRGLRMLALAWGLASVMPMAHAACSDSGTTDSGALLVSCVDSFDGYSDSRSNIRVEVNKPSGWNSPQSLHLTGSNIYLMNRDFIANNGQRNHAGVVIGNGSTNASKIDVYNNGGQFHGTSDQVDSAPFDSRGLALNVQNKVGSTEILNAGYFQVFSFSARKKQADMAAIALWGGAPIKFSNISTVIGRVAFQGSATGNTFSNYGSVLGSVSLGVGGGPNRFETVTGSVVCKQCEYGDGGHDDEARAASFAPISFAGAGIVDAGSANNGNILALQNRVGGGSGLAGTGSINGNRYLNFSKLIVDAGTWTLQGGLFASAIHPTVELKDGLLTVESGALGSAAIAGNGGALGFAASGTVLGNAISLEAKGLSVSGNDLTLSGGVSGSGALNKTGTGYLLLSGNNSFSGGLKLNGGKLILTSAGAAGAGAISGAAELENRSAQVLINSVELDRNLTLAGSNNLMLSGAITGSGSLTKNGASALILGGASDFSGGVQLNGGSLTLFSGTALGTGTLTLGVDSSLDASGQTIGNAISLGAQTLNVIGARASSLGGAITGTGAIIKSGAGDLTLGGTNSFSGGLQLQAGKLVIGSSTALGTGELLTFANTMLDSGGAPSVTNKLRLGGNLTVLGSKDLSLSGAITGAGDLIKTGASNLTLGGGNDFNGNVRLGAGRLTLAHGNALGDNALLLTGNAALDASGQSIGNGIDLGAWTLDVLGAGGSTVRGDIFGSGAITKSGAGDLTLSGDNSFGGGVRLSAGKLILAKAGPQVGAPLPPPPTVRHWTTVQR